MAEIRRLESSAEDFMQQLEALLAWESVSDDHVNHTVNDIITTIRNDGDIESIGIGVPGAIRRGVVQHARNISVETLDLEAAVAAATGVPVRVANDVNAAALGAWRLCGGSSSAFAYLNLGTGMAAALSRAGGAAACLSLDHRQPRRGDGRAAG